MDTPEAKCIDDGECPKILDHDVRRVSFREFKFLETPTPSTIGALSPSRLTENLGDDDLDASRFKSVCDSGYATPKIKSGGFQDQPVRRRLFSPISENVPESFYQSEKSPSKESEPIPIIASANINPEPTKQQETTAVQVKDKEEATSLGIPEVNAKAKTSYLGYRRINEDSKENSKPKLVDRPLDRKPLENKNEKNGRVAQLVIWTRNNSSGKVKEKETGTKEVKGTSSSTNPPILSTNSTAITVKTVTEEPLRNPEGDLFFVQYPVRSLTETSKNKSKGPKRVKRAAASPIQGANPPKRKSHNKKRSANSGQGSSSGRAYREYLHTCLEKQRQQLRSSADFKVEKLFQPEQGVALPGEIVPVPATIAPPPPPAYVSTNPVEQTEEVLATAVAPVNHPEIVKSTVINSPSKILDIHNPFLTKVGVESPTFHQISPVAFSVPAVSTKEFELGKSENCASDVSKIACENQGVSIEGGESTLFDLPDRFTVTTDSTNEFDLLIQNVVHEEMVDDMSEDEFMKMEGLRKKAKLCGINRASTGEDDTNMDEPGKPRCTYTELIEKALTETGGLTVSEIYNWISERYPFYKPDDDRWKNSVRHNLSINPYFKKGDKARSGAGHLWTISEESKGLRPSSMVSWDERRKSPSDPYDLNNMSFQSETDRSVATILAQYASACRASQQSSENDKSDTKTDKSYENKSMSSLNPTKANPECTSATLAQTQLPAADPQQGEKGSEAGAMCNTVSMPADVATFNLNELNSGQFTVDLSGITIPDGGSLNLEELANNGRLIYIQADSDANKENDSTQALILNEYMLSELSSITGGNSGHDESRLNSFINDPSLNFDLGFGKVDAVPNSAFLNDVSQIGTTTSAPTFTSVSYIGNGNNSHHDGLLAPGCSQLIPLTHQTEASMEFNPHQDLISLDHLAMSSYDVGTSLGSTSNGTDLSESLASLTSAAMYESKELGLSYMYQTEPSNHDLL